MSWKRFFQREKWDEERAQELQAHPQIEADENVSRAFCRACSKGRRPATRCSTSIVKWGSNSSRKSRSNAGAKLAVLDESHWLKRVLSKPDRKKNASATRQNVSRSIP